jgi:carbamoyltransferase
LPTRILGISAYYHDSAACLVEDGRIVAACAGGALHPEEARRGLSNAGGRILPGRGRSLQAQIDYVGFYEKPLVKFERLLETYTASAPRGWKSYLMAMPLWLGEKLWLSDDIHDHLEGCEAPVLFGEHHESHAASAFYPSPFEEAAVLTIDGVRRVGDFINRPRTRQFAGDCARSSAFRIRLDSCIRRSRISPDSRSTPANTR